MSIKVIVVNKKDHVLGYKDKQEVHKLKSTLHRAFAAFVLDDKGNILIQKRSRFKPLWPLYWDNTCSSHPLPNEGYLAAGERRLKEEFDFSCKLKFLYKFYYRAEYRPKDSRARLVPDPGSSSSSSRVCTTSSAPGTTPRRCLNFSTYAVEASVPGASAILRTPPRRGTKDPLQFSDSYGILRSAQNDERTRKSCKTIGTEEEICAVLVGRYNGKVKPDPKEVAAHRWVGFSALTSETNKEPEKFTPWLKLILQNFKQDKGHLRLFANTSHSERRRGI